MCCRVISRHLETTLLLRRFDRRCIIVPTARGPGKYGINKRKKTRARYDSRADARRGPICAMELFLDISRPLYCFDQRSIIVPAARRPGEYRIRNKKKRRGFVVDRFIE